MCRTNLDPLVLLASTSLLALFGCTSEGTAVAETDGPTSSTGSPNPNPSGSTGGPGSGEGLSTSGEGSTAADESGTDTTGNPEITVAAGPTKGGPIAANEAGDRLAVANKGTGDVTIFEIDGAADPVELARIAVGEEPTSVAWNAAGTEVFVVNRGSGSVSRIVDADGNAPTVDGTVEVGSEPSIGALSPTGQRLYVSNWADGSLSVVDTAAMEVLDTLALESVAI